MLEKIIILWDFERVAELVLAALIIFRVILFQALSGTTLIECYGNLNKP
ncbi:hypothetical protein [uncultured Clostridium sp.]